MKKVSGAISVRVPSAECFDYVHRSVSDDRLLAAYAALRGSSPYSGRVVEAGRPHRLRIVENTVDSLMEKQGVFSTGWTISYSFAPRGADSTFVEIAVEYDLVTAALGLSTTEGQARNEILHRINALLALEAGRHAQHAAVSW